MKKNLIKSIIFLSIFFILFYFIRKLLWLTPFPISHLYDEPKDSLDIVYVGGSNAYVHFNSVLAYDMYGYATYMVGAASQPFPLIKYCIIESEKYQNPSLYIIDLAKVAQDIDTYELEFTRKTTDSMKFSQNRIDAINEMLGYKNLDKKEYINYYFSFLMYHNRWKELHRINIFKENKLLYKGFKMYDTTVQKNEVEKFVWNDSIKPLKEENKKVLMSLIDYIKTNKLNVLFIVPPIYFSDEENQEINDAICIIKDNGLEVINFDTLDEYAKNIDYTSDYYSNNHLNVYGSIRYTLYFGEYLKEKYNLEDHRNDLKYDSWNKEYIRFKKEFKNLTQEDFDEILSQYIN